MSNLSEKLRNAREIAGLSQLQAAELSGIGYKTINNYENAVSRPDVEKLALLCKAYNISADFFLNLDFNKKKESQAPAEADTRDNSEEIYTCIKNHLIESGIIKENEDITDNQLLILDVIGKLISNYF